MTGDRCRAANAFVREARALLNVSVVEGCGLLVNRDPTGWVMDVSLSGVPFDGGSSSSTTQSPPGVFSVPAQTVTGAPAWTPTSNTYPAVWNSVDNVLYVWNGGSWVNISTAVSGSVTFGTTSSVSVAPTTQLVIPVLTVAGPPTYTGTKGEVICDGDYFYQYTGTTWVTYQPTTVPQIVTITTGNTVTPVTTSTTTAITTGTPGPGFGVVEIVKVDTTTPGNPVPALTTTTTLTAVTTGVETSKTVLTMPLLGTPTTVLTLTPTVITPGVPIAVGTTSSLSVAPPTYVGTATLTTTGVPVFTVPAGVPVYNTVDNTLFISQGGGTFTPVLVGTVLAGKVAYALTDNYLTSTANLRYDGLSLVLHQTNATPDADLDESDLSFWLDDTTGAPVLHSKVKDNAGTVFDIPLGGTGSGSSAGAAGTVQKSDGAGGFLASAITDDGTTVTANEGFQVLVSAMGILAIDGSGHLGFFGAAAVPQYATTGTTAGFTAGSGTAVKSDSTFTGNFGAGTAYTIGDIVRCLKSFGLMDD